MRGVGFGSSQMLDEALKVSQTSYFRKSDLLEGLSGLDNAPDFSSSRAEYKAAPSHFFPITVAVREVEP
jgi:hypothetical protein